MDQGIGKIVASLDGRITCDNTLIFYMQDNGACRREVGPPGRRTRDTRSQSTHARTGQYHGHYGEAWANVSNTPFRYYKHYVHEGGISTPMIAHWPAGISRRGELEHQPGHLIDIMTTCVDVPAPPIRLALPTTPFCPGRP